MGYTNLHRQWKQDLDKKTKKINHKEAERLMQQQGAVETKEGNIVVIRGKNFSGRDIEIRNHNRKEAYKDLATLNGFTVE